MLAVEVRLLAGTYTASEFNNRQEPEWPIHPGRLFSALVATWAAAGSDPQERVALIWLESQAPPKILCSSMTAISRRQVVTHFVPGNDASASRDVHGLGDKISTAERLLDSVEGPARTKAVAALDNLVRQAVAVTKQHADPRRVSTKVLLDTLELLPERRGKQARYYPTVRPPHPVVRMTWSDSPPAGLERLLDRLLARVGRLGHSSTLTSCRVASGDPEATGDALSAYVHDADTAGQTAVGRAAESLSLRVMTPGLLYELESAYARHQGNEPHTLPMTFASYSVEGAERARPRPSTGGDWVVFTFAAGAHCPVTDTLALTRSLRGAIMSHARDPLSPVLSGHEAGGPAKEAHVSWLALPNTGSARSDGRVMALALALPVDVDLETRAQIEEAVRLFQESGSTLHWRDRDISLNPAITHSYRGSRLDARARASDRTFWARPSTSWVTATPIALDRYPRALRTKGSDVTDRFVGEVGDIVSLACARAALPKPTSVEVVLGSPLAGIPPMGRQGTTRAGGRFPAYRANASTTRYAVHARVRFAQPVRGPIIIGAGRHFGYGLLLPQPEPPQVSAAAE